MLRHVRFALGSCVPLGLELVWDAAGSFALPLTITSYEKPYSRLVDEAYKCLQSEAVQRGTVETKATCTEQALPPETEHAHGITHQSCEERPCV